MTKGKISGLVAAALLGSLAGCAHTPSAPPPGPVVSGFPPACNSCGQPGLPRRLTPAPAPLPPGTPPPGYPPQTGAPPQTDFRPFAGPDQAFKPQPATQRPPAVRLSPPQVGETQS